MFHHLLTFYKACLCLYLGVWISQLMSVTIFLFSVWIRLWIHYIIQPVSIVYYMNTIKVVCMYVFLCTYYKVCVHSSLSFIMIISQNTVILSYKAEWCIQCQLYCCFLGFVPLIMYFSSHMSTPTVVSHTHTHTEEKTVQRNISLELMMPERDSHRSVHQFISWQVSCIQRESVCAYSWVFAFSAWLCLGLADHKQAWGLSIVISLPTLACSHAQTHKHNFHPITSSHTHPPEWVQGQ